MSDAEQTWLLGPGWLFCPADRPDRYTKALAVADMVILDLEDAVSPEHKEDARIALRQLADGDLLDRERTVVRINSPRTNEHSADVQLVTDLGLPRVMLSRAEHAADIMALECDVIPLVETVGGAERAGSLAGPENVIAMMWGADDLVASMGGTSSRHADGSYRDIARFVRSRVLVAAKSHERLALDSVHMDIGDVEGLRVECEDAVAVGFDATVAIHPTQLEVIRDAYKPSTEQVEWARALFEHVGKDRGVATFRDRMVDGPIFKQAEKVLRLAKLAAQNSEDGLRTEHHVGAEARTPASGDV